MIAMVHDSTSEYYSPHTRILLLTPPPVGEAQRNADLASRNPPRQPDREWNNTKAYADAVIEVGTGMPRVGVVNMWEAIWGAAGEDVARLPVFLSDGLHLTVAGYQVSKFLQNMVSNSAESASDCISRNNEGHREHIPRGAL